MNRRCEVHRLAPVVDRHVSGMGQPVVRDRVVPRRHWRLTARITRWTHPQHGDVPGRKFRQRRSDLAHDGSWCIGGASLHQLSAHPDAPDADRQSFQGRQHEHRKRIGRHQGQPWCWSGFEGHRATVSEAPHGPRRVSGRQLARSLQRPSCGAPTRRPRDVPCKAPVSRHRHRHRWRPPITFSLLLGACCSPAWRRAGCLAECLR